MKPLLTIRQTCITTLSLRNMVRPFKDGMLDQACPMGDILDEVQARLAQVQALRQA